MSEALAQKIKKQLLSGDYCRAEKEFYRIYQQKATLEWQTILNELCGSKEAHESARSLKEHHGYGVMRRTRVTVTTMTGDRVTIPTWYALKKGKKKGKQKMGRNGRGDHLLLRFWGFIGKNSVNYVSRVARCGVSTQSYDIAETELKEQGIPITSNSVALAVQKVGVIAQRKRDSIALTQGETCAGKRIIIAIDGGRVRVREKRSGRRTNDQVLPRFDPAWREPKLLVIAELDEQGNYCKGTKPIYEATLENHDDLFDLLERIAKQINLNQAKEIIFSGDGAPWIWNKFAWIAKRLDLKGKTTEILDFYHAAEHLSEIAEASEERNEPKRKQWFLELKSFLREGKFKALKQSIKRESRVNKNPELMNLFQYFERNKDRIHYDRYENNQQPIGSGIVESAIRRVINLKLKSPSIFWNKDNLERMLQLRCVLMAGRWNIMMGNVVKVVQFRVDDDM